MSTFDLIAIGRHLSTTLAAALLAKEGARVLLVCGRETGPSYASGPHALSSRLDTLVGLERPSVRAVASALGLDRLFERRSTSTSPSFQLLLPTARIDISDDDAVLEEGLCRELPELTPNGLEGLLVRLARTSQKVDRWLESFVESGGRAAAEEVEEPSADDLLPEALGRSGVVLDRLLRAPAAAGAVLSSELIPSAAVARAFSCWKRGTSTLEGGVARILSTVRDLIRAWGGEVLEGSEPLSLHLRGGRPAGVIVEGRAGTWLSERFLLGGSPARLGRLLASVEGAVAGLPAFEVVGRRYVLHLVLRRGWTPRSMARHLLAVDPRGFGLVELEASDPLPSTGQMILSAQTTAPVARCSPEGLASLRGEVLELARRIVPFFDEAFLYATSPHDGVGLSGPLADELPSRLGRRIALPMEPVYGSSTAHAAGDGVRVGLHASPLALETVPGLAVVHPLVLAALGIEGEFATALAAARALEGSSPVPSPQDEPVRDGG
jgi:hypothetical protein